MAATWRRPFVITDKPSSKSQWWFLFSMLLCCSRSVWSRSRFPPRVAANDYATNQRRNPRSETGAWFACLLRKFPFFSPYFSAFPPRIIQIPTIIHAASTNPKIPPLSSPTAHTNTCMHVTQYTRFLFKTHESFRLCATLNSFLTIEWIIEISRGWQKEIFLSPSILTGEQWRFYVKCLFETFKFPYFKFRQKAEEAGDADQYNEIISKFSWRIH